MAEKKKIAFVTLGCKLNYAETSTYERGFAEAGLEIVPWEEEADLYLVNTCTVTEHSDKKCRNIIRKLHRVSPGAGIIVTGCYAELKKAEIEKIEGVEFVFGAQQKKEVVPTVLQHISGGSSRAKEQIHVDECSIRHTKACDTGAQSFLPAYSSGERTRSFLKVQDGCDYFCSYCTVPFARGRSRNSPIAELVAQAHEIAAGGIREIVLTGVNTGDFGKTTGEKFLDLLKALEDVEDIERYRISSIEPNLLTEEIVDWIASGTKFLPHFHIPLQSGSDTVLKAMGRRYDTDTFARKISYIRNAMEHPGSPKVFFGIDVIVGFPGETDELFGETYRFLKETVRPAFIHIFPYSRRSGTRAATMKGQVQESVKTLRVKALEELCAELHSGFVESNRGVREKVLFESSDKNGMMYGYTGNYIRVERPYDSTLAGKIVELTL
ncbi:MAG: tRNA (N(6)-L-threonylcarbamoyladenosine(37)-C(2))-methylthiotransferase MtaB [Bacteroidetes bacterium]|uniref:tRNA (N(6)-L-threonylcarbamoyladenosine(37)-C(2))-methylthiotransferase MtaB n=1 Tax=Candidatus Cryptobacteroides excrementipullorum TaxID=2840761 RepID=A0A9D9NKW5_9BACT|nr:tRNA (N(6)-L-threonylcarbamoyladenosine(37)-C(2))-methylthiotransferase MtaB [Candidatus Cryptobacteroides excrementipullorum]